MISFEERNRRRDAARGKPCPFKIGDMIVYADESGGPIDDDGRPLYWVGAQGRIVEVEDDVPTEMDKVADALYASAGLRVFERDPWVATVEWPWGRELVRPENEGVRWRRS